MLLVVVGCCWLLLGCCWLLLVVVGCCWLLLVVVGCCWSHCSFIVGCNVPCCSFIVPSLFLHCSCRCSCHVEWLYYSFKNLSLLEVHFLSDFLSFSFIFFGHLSFIFFHFLSLDHCSIFFRKNVDPAKRVCSCSFGKETFIFETKILQFPSGFCVSISFNFLHFSFIFFIIFLHHFRFMFFHVLSLSFIFLSFSIIFFHFLFLCWVLQNLIFFGPQFRYGFS